MKIGEFARKHNVTIDTVRHYISMGLLTPLRINVQYDFSEIDDDVMESILLLKSMNFKLEEMKPYLLLQTIYTQNTFSYLGSFEDEFRNKLRENKIVMDYAFIQDYDVETYQNSRFEMYPYFSKNARAECFKALIHKGKAPVQNEKDFIERMKESGWSAENIYSSAFVTNKKEAPDMTFFEKTEDLKLRYCIYRLKTLG